MSFQGHKLSSKCSSHGMMNCVFVNTTWSLDAEVAV